MKGKLSLIFIFHLTCISNLFAKAKTASEIKERELKSKTEEFSAKSGTLIQKEFIDVGMIKGCQYKLLI